LTAPTSALARLAAAARPGLRRSQVVVGLLCALLGFAFAVQVRATAQAGLDTLRQGDLLGILNDVSERSARLQAEARQLERTRDELTSGSDGSRAALEQTRAQAIALGILAGTLPAQGRGVTVRVTDPVGYVDSTTLVDVIQELRGAGAEAIECNDVRVVASTAFIDGPPGTVLIDATAVTPPYTITAIGDPSTLTKALEIPGGVVDLIAGFGLDEVGNPRASVSISGRDLVTVDALAEPREPAHATRVPDDDAAP